MNLNLQKHCSIQMGKYMFQNILEKFCKQFKQNFFQHVCFFTILFKKNCIRYYLLMAQIKKMLLSPRLFAITKILRSIPVS